ncbi:hypothetical protein [Lentzea sp. NPDC092896]|uniref:hypothetical protein n=1 Tax=Lentzea sp. NPDC092896 TaxID=3364127 RepID=UPI003804068E
MSDFPNLDKLRKTDPNKLTARQLQVLLIQRTAENTNGSFAERTTRTASLGADVPALLAHIDELYGEIEHLRKYTETTKYHQDQHAAAVRNLEKARAEVVQIAIDTSPHYRQMRDERDSARRERDEAMAKLDRLKGTVEVAHVRETSTSTNLLIADGETQHGPDQLLADCSCGGSYYAPAGGDEYGALESAHAEHVRLSGGAK